MGVGLALGDEEGELGVLEDNILSSPRTFFSKDPGVNELVDAIENRFPGSVKQVGIKIYGWSGQELTDFDVVTDTHIIQVKAGTGQGLGGQLSRTQELTDRAVVGFDANQLIGNNQLFKPSVVKYANQLGFEVFNNVEQLLDSMQEIKEEQMYARSYINN